jgi:hypothetical protein
MPDRHGQSMFLALASGRKAPMALELSVRGLRIPRVAQCVLSAIAAMDMGSPAFEHIDRDFGLIDVLSPAGFSLRSIQNIWGKLRLAVSDRAWAKIMSDLDADPLFYRQRVRRAA